MTSQTRLHNFLSAPENNCFCWNQEQDDFVIFRGNKAINQDVLLLFLSQLEPMYGSAIFSRRHKEQRHDDYTDNNNNADNNNNNDNDISDDNCNCEDDDDDN